MNRLVPLFTIALIALSVASCQRKAVHKIRPDFIGYWRHKEIDGERWYIEIDKKSWGTVTVYGLDGKFSKEHLYGENPRKWRYNEERQELTNGIISERFKVNQLPTIAETMIISGYDTVSTGMTYCIINNDYYIRQK